MNKSILTGVVSTLVMVVATAIVVTNGKLDKEVVIGEQNIESVLCVGEYGDAATYHINMPVFEGFTIEVTKALKSQYIEGFCASL